MSLVGFAQYGIPRRPFIGLAQSVVRLYRPGTGGDGELVVIGDLGEDDHAVLHASSKLFLSFRFNVKCRISLRLVEPRAIKSKHYSLMSILAPSFHRIFSHYTPLVSHYRNARWIAHGGSWLRCAVDPEATRFEHMSLIASAKKITEGHRLRHRIADWGRVIGAGIRLLGHGYEPFADRADGFLPYRYSIVIENSRDQGYFTEKLIDCLLCGTVPIYWGDPDIGRYFDLDGIIACGNEDEICRAVLFACEEDFRSRRSAILRNAKTALRYVDSRADMTATLLSES